ncbi:RND superfamily putative drug exporter [Paenibacillus turicensis]|uniref:RND superfamily putative drug exporter n=1 Tax=Paenibacillus turicensis TaxID=160487 RepID=A0ABS4FVE6_9BACL|nr:MMPL family transporter [Paenibacillus turicensis]MBP1906434.1 RND superfamily putative drug exporter [Paenibacillus turicensis]
MGILLEKMGRYVAGKRSKWITLAVWILIAVILSSVWPAVNKVTQNNAPNLGDEMPSVIAAQLAEEQFPSDAGIPALFVFKRDGGLTDADYGHLTSLTSHFTANPALGQQLVVPFDKIPLPVLKGQASKDGSTIVLPFFFEKGLDSADITKAIDAIEAQMEKEFKENPFKQDLDKQGELSVRVTGPAGISKDASGLFADADVSLLISTVLLVLVLLLLIYRSPILAIIPLIAVGFAYIVTSPILGKLAEMGVITVDSQGISIMTVLLFGAGTDYCLFLISHFRQTLLEEKSKAKALVIAFRDSAGAIAMSGFTVVLSLLVLLFAKYGAVHRFAVPFSLSILIMAAASLTLVPALLAILGRASFFPFIPRTPEMLAAKNKTPKQPRKSAGWIGRIVTNRPWTVVLVTMVILVGLAVNALRVEYTVDLLSSFPESSQSRQGFNVIGEKFTPGELAPAKVMIDTEGKEVDLKSWLVDQPYISNVSEQAKGATNEAIQAVDIEFNINPYSNEAMSHIPEIQSLVADKLKEQGINDADNKVWVSGLTATQYDTEHTNLRDTEVIIPIVIGLIALLLLVYLRSITAMIYLILTVVLSYFSALGLGWIIIHDFMGVSAIQGLIPLYAFVFLVALGEDYNIFLVSSIWRKSKEMPLKEAISQGVNETGSVITSAGLILAGTFAVLTTLPIQVLVQFGLIAAIGVLLDTFVVRPFLVPSITMLLGRVAFWPAKFEEKQGIKIEGK